MAEIYQFKHPGEQIDVLLDKADNAVQPLIEGDRTYIVVDGLIDNDDVYYYLPNRAPNAPAHTFAMVSEVQALQEKKIDKTADDYYPQLSVGVADNLAGVDEVARVINFGQSGGGAITDGVARVQSIKGNSVVWNQLLSGDFSVQYGTLTQANNTYTIVPSGDYPGVKKDGVAPIVGHKYIAICSKTGGSSELKLNWAGYDAQVNMVFSASNVNKSSFIIYANHEADTFTLTKPILVDLTLMFGAGNEPTTIEEFYQRIPQGIDLNAYNEGEVISMRADGVKSVGRNQWNEQWELGTIDSNTGVETSNSSTIRPKNFIKVLPSCDYYIASQVNDWVLFYDEKKVLCGKHWAGSVKTFTTPANCHYLKFRLPSSYGTTYKNDICINLSNADINGQYFPYEEVSEDLSLVAKYFPNGMRSAGTAYDEIRYNKSTNRWGKVVRIGEVDMGSLTWQMLSSGETRRFSVDARYLPTMKMPNGNSDNNIVLCSLYPCSTFTNIASKDKVIMPSTYSNEIISIKDLSYTSAESFKAAMSGVMLYYELAEPIVTEIEEKDFNLDYEVWNCGTEQMVATEPSAPLAADITYGFNAVGLIKQLRAMIEALSAKVASL